MLKKVQLMLTFSLFLSSNLFAPRGRAVALRPGQRVTQTSLPLTDIKYINESGVEESFYPNYSPEGFRQTSLDFQSLALIFSNATNRVASVNQQHFFHVVVFCQRANKMLGIVHRVPKTHLEHGDLQALSDTEDKLKALLDLPIIPGGRTIRQLDEIADSEAVVIFKISSIEDQSNVEHLETVLPKNRKSFNRDSLANLTTLKNIFLVQLNDCYKRIDKQASGIAIGSMVPTTTTHSEHPMAILGHAIFPGTSPKLSVTEQNSAELKEYFTRALASSLKGSVKSGRDFCLVVCDKSNQPDAIDPCMVGFGIKKGVAQLFRERKYDALMSELSDGIGQANSIAKASMKIACILITITVDPESAENRILEFHFYNNRAGHVGRKFKETQTELFFLAEQKIGSIKSHLEVCFDEFVATRKAETILEAQREIAEAKAATTAQQTTPAKQKKGKGARTKPCAEGAPAQQDAAAASMEITDHGIGYGCHAILVNEIADFLNILQSANGKELSGEIAGMVSEAATHLTTMHEIAVEVFGHEPLVSAMKAIEYLSNQAIADSVCIDFAQDPLKTFAREAIQTPPTNLTLEEVKAKEASIIGIQESLDNLYDTLEVSLKNSPTSALVHPAQSPKRTIELPKEAVQEPAPTDAQAANVQEASQAPMEQEPPALLIPIERGKLGRFVFHNSAGFPAQLKALVPYAFFLPGKTESRIFSLNKGSETILEIIFGQNPEKTMPHMYIVKSNITAQDVREMEIIILQSKNVGLKAKLTIIIEALGWIQENLEFMEIRDLQTTAS